MKTIQKIIIGLMLLLTLVASSFAVMQEDHNLAAEYSYQELSQEEIDGIMLMREEEKLARDVYLELYDLWGQKTFNNIAQSEGHHMDAMYNLIEKYDLEDPITIDERGVFVDENLQTLYNDLVEKGSKSLVDALIVGATIEDLDIYDLQELRKISDNDDIGAIYQNLEKGSRNHLRSFTQKIEQFGGTYTNQYISDEYYNEILSTPKEQGIVYGPNKEIVERYNESQMHQNQGEGQGNGRGYKNQQVVQEEIQNEVQLKGNQDQNQQIGFFQKMWRGFIGWFN